MLTVSLPICNRPQYLTRTLEALRQADPRGYMLVVAAEPAGPECRELCESVDFMPVEIFQNATRLGQRANCFNAVNLAFELGSEFNIYLEDDIVLSPDALDMARWFHSQHDHFMLSFFNYQSDPARPTELYTCREFAPYGFTIPLYAWERHIKTAWFDDTHELHAQGWDWSLAALMKHEPSLRIGRPYFSRANQIGREGGTFVTPEFHDKTFAHLPVANSKPAGQYSVVEDRPDWFLRH